MDFISSNFGSMVFNQNTMKQRLPKDVFNNLQRTIQKGEPLDISIADTVACAMKEWALEKGATHFTHWFQPMIGITAEKHESFITKDNEGRVITEFSGKELIKGEPDASSFPSGGLRSTFEARGYTAWDPSSYAFVKDGSLYIPTIFCSYSGESLDKKMPLLRSCEILNKQALRILKLFNNTSVKRVIPTSGAEQEYFLIDKKVYEKRKDLVACQRTLFGARSAKGQKLEDHYFGDIRPRVLSFMKELDSELWKLGILARTKHNEVAPAQHELAPVFTSINLATDQNHIVMQTMKKIAEKHDLVCLLHEKPFDGINGSGKHNNWSLCTDTGVNLLDPGTSPAENVQFLLFLCAIIKGVDEYQDLLRASVASAGNDLRLGADEAPPCIISIFLGEELTEILTAIEKGIKYGAKPIDLIEMGLNLLPKFPRDSTDRNRTSPFAFTNNKFEFRMVGSNLSIACPNIMLNTIVAEELSLIADQLENCDNIDEPVFKLIASIIRNHKRIIFNGNSYSKEWYQEATNRGLSILKTTVDALPALVEEKNINIFIKHRVYSRAEIEARYKMLLENYCKVINIEAQTMVEMATKQILPASFKYLKLLSETVCAKKNVLSNINCTVEENIISELSDVTSKLYNCNNALKTLVEQDYSSYKILDVAHIYKNNIIPAMKDLRTQADILEKNISEEFWPYPTYNDIFLSV